MSVSRFALIALLLLYAPSAGGAEPAPAPVDSLQVQVWETTIHSQPEVAHRGQPFELHIHLVWGSPGGEETLLPLWRDLKDLELLETSYECRTTRDQPGGRYAMHARLMFRLVATREGIVPLDTVRVALVRGSARRVVVFAPTAIRVLPPVSLWPRTWNLLAFGAGLAALGAGILLARRGRPRKDPRPGSASPEALAEQRLRALESSPPTKPNVDRLIVHIRSEATRRHGGTWTRSGEAAFQAWAAASDASEAVRSHVGALISHLEARRYLPQEPDAATWQQWMSETRRLWDTGENTDPPARTGP